MRTPHSPQRGFTLVEIMVAMVILAIGLLGMAAMTVLVMRGNKGANDLTVATNLCQMKLEALKDVSWDALGDAASTLTEDVRGKAEGAMYQEGALVHPNGLNAQGKTQATVQTEYTAQGLSGSTLDDAVKNAGPYKYARTFVICKGSEDPYPFPGSELVQEPASSGGNYTESPSAPDCRADPANGAATRPKSLGCFASDIATATGGTNKEKKIKVLCTWRSSDGQCHSVNLATTVVDLSN